MEGKGLTSSDWLEECFKTFRDSVIYDSKDVLALLLGDLGPPEPAETDPWPSQRPEIVEEIVKRLLEDCQDDIEAIKQAHRPESDPECPTNDEYRPEHAMYGPLVRAIALAAMLRTVPTVCTGEHPSKDQRDV